MNPDGPPLKLALVTRRYPPLLGGAEKVFSYLAAALAAQGAEVAVVTARPSDLERMAPAAPAVEPCAMPGGKLTVFRPAGARLRFAGTWLHMERLRLWLERHPIDLAYVSMLKHDAYVAVASGKRLGFPVVLRPEGAGATGDLAWQSWGRYGRRIGRRCHGADAVVSISPAITAELSAAGYDPRKIVELPNGVPVPEAPWQCRPGWPAEPHAVFVGRLAREKGLDLLIDAWPIVRARQPQARLTLIGEGPERPALTARLARLGLAGVVALPGAMDDPAEALRGGDLFVLPSREEGMSVALLEAMALGMPLVASAIAGNRRLVADGEVGRLAPPDDPTALAGAILDQWADFDHALAMGRAARRLVAREYSSAVVAGKHIELFRRLIARQG